MDCDVRDLGMAGTGRERIEWAAKEMRGLALIATVREGATPRAGWRIGAVLHVRPRRPT